METIKISRFSYDAFHPQSQEGYIKENLIKKGDNYNSEFDYGIWVFVKGKEDKYLLNHLEEDEIQNISCWVADIPLTTKIYKHDNAHEKAAISTVKDEIKECAFFVPEASIKEISNIRETYNRFAE